MINSKSNISGWSLDDGYKNQAKDETYPVRAFGSNKNSLVVTIKGISSSDTVCSSSSNLITVTASIPGEDSAPFFIDSIKRRKNNLDLIERVHLFE